MEKTNQGYLYCLSILLIMLIILSLLLAIVYPIMLVVTIICSITEIIIVKRVKENKQYIKIQKEKELKYLNNGYEKLYDNIYLKEEEKKIIINNKDYDFSQIVDCELITDNSSVNTTIGKSKGKLKNSGKIKGKSISTTVNTEYCNDMYINVVVDDFDEPNIRINLIKNALIYVNGKKYKEMQAIGNKIVATLKLIVSKNNNPNQK